MYTNNFLSSCSTCLTRTINGSLTKRSIRKSHALGKKVLASKLTQCSFSLPPGGDSLDPDPDSDSPMEIASDSWNKISSVCLL